VLSPRWKKLWSDLRVERGRVALMVTAVAVSLIAVGAVLGAMSILTREIAVNYLGTRPAAATLELPEGVDAGLLAAVRARQEVAEADARDVVLARVQVGDDWRPLLLFAASDFDDLRLNVFRPQSGAWPPLTGDMLIERSAIAMVSAGEGQRVLVKAPHGSPRELRISGVVHDPGLAPAWQEREGYGYVGVATLATLGEPPLLHELRVSFRGSDDMAAIEAAAADLAGWLVAHGHPVHEIRIPPPGQHPHQRQMTTILLLMLAFSGMALLLSGVLVGNTLAAMLIRQVREIGVMKTVGARAGQLARMYALFVASLGFASFAVAVPLGLAGAWAFSGAVASMLNFTLNDRSVPPWVFAAQAAAGILVPLAVALLPISRAARTSVRQAIDQYGARGEFLGSALTRLPAPVRNALRRPARLALTICLLSCGGAMFITAVAVARAWERNLEKVHETRHYDLEVRFSLPEADDVARRLAGVEGVKTLERWGYTPAAFARPGQIDVVRTYPDRGHGSLSVLGPPPQTELIGFPLLAGRWLRPDDADAVVLNHVAVAQARGASVGDRVTLSLDGAQSEWTIVGIVEEVGSPGVAYVTDTAFRRATGRENGARMLRIATDATTPMERTRIIHLLEEQLRSAGGAVEAVIPFSELRTAIGDHVAILIRALMAMAAIMAIVGLLGLASSMGMSVVERTREIGVMKAIGATPERVLLLVGEEALFIAAASWALAVLLSLPLTWFVDRLIGQLGFLAPLPFVLAPWAMLAWLALVLIAAVVATLLPARRAASLTVCEALAET
jgi:putative ABC transport system permease protein